MHKNVNWFYMFIFGSALFSILLGLTIIWLGGQISRLVCTRSETSQVDCQLERRFLGVIPAGNRMITRLSGTEVEEDCSEEGCSYWIELQADGGNVRLTRFSTYHRPDVLTDQQQLDESLNNTNLSAFEYTSSPYWWLLLASIPLIAGGGWLVTGYRDRLLEPK